MDLNKQITAGLAALSVGLSANVLGAEDRTGKGMVDGDPVLQTFDLKREGRTVKVTIPASSPVEIKADAKPAVVVSPLKSGGADCPKKVSDRYQFGNPPANEFGPTVFVKDGKPGCINEGSYTRALNTLLAENYGAGWKDSKYSVGPIKNPIFKSEGKDIVSRLEIYNNGKQDTVQIYNLSFAYPSSVNVKQFTGLDTGLAKDVSGTQVWEVRKKEAAAAKDAKAKQELVQILKENKTIPKVDLLATPEVPKVTQVVPVAGSVKSQYDNIKGSMAFVLEGSRWPTVASVKDDKLEIRAISRIDEEDGKYLVSKHTGEVDKNWAVLSMLRGALNGSIEANTLSNYVFMHDIIINGNKLGNYDYLVAGGANLEKIIGKESCLDREPCNTLTEAEYVRAVGNLAAYDTTARVIVSKNESMNPKALIKADTMGEFVKGWGGYLLPWNHIIANSTGYTGHDLNSEFNDKQKAVFEKCAPGVNVGSKLFGSFSANEVKTPFKPFDVLTCVYNGTKDVVYGGVKK